VDVDARTAREVKGAGALDEGLVFDATGHWAIWPGESRTWIVDLETASARTIDVVAATIQPAGDVIVVEAGDEVLVVTLATGAERFRMGGIAWSVSTDGKRFVWSSKTAEGSHKLHIRDLEKGGERRLTTISPPKGDCTDAAWQWQPSIDADGSLSGRACYGDYLHVNLTTGRARLTRDEPTPQEGDGGYYDQQLASCKQLGAVHCDDGFIVSSVGRSILPFADGVATIDPKIEARAVLLPESQLADLRDQTHGAIGKNAIALIDSSGRARVWNDKTGSVLYRSEAQAEPVAFAAIAREGAELVTLAPHGVVRRWNVRTGELLSTRALRSCVAAALAIASDGTPLVACDDDHAVVVWDAAKNIILAERDGVLPALDGANRMVALFRTDDRSAVDVFPLDGGAAKTFKINGMYSATAVAIGSGRVAVANGALAVIIDVKSGAEVARRGDVRNTGFTLSSDGAWAVYESHTGIRALRLDHGTAAQEPIALPEGRIADLRRFAVEDGTVVASNANHEVFGWTLDPPARTLALRPTADVLALSSDGARIVLGTRGAKIADRDGLGNARTFLAVPYTNAGITFAANERPAIFGNPVEARALLRCAVGDVVLPYASCLGRFAD